MCSIFIHVKNYFSVLLFVSLFFTNNIFSQKISPAQDHRIALVGATIHVGNGEVLEQASIVFENGKITAVGTDISTSTAQEVIDVKGKHIYPGLIDAATTLGLEEIEAVRATSDSREVGEINPSIRSIISYNTDSRVIPTILSNGIVLSHIIPTNQAVGGQSSVVQMNAWNYEDASYAQDIALNIYWPRKPIIRNDRDKEKLDENNARYQAQLEKIKSLFDAAKTYCNTKNNAEKNLNLEAICEVLNGKKKLIVYTNGAKEMIDAGLWAKSLNLPLTICGGAESYKILSFLKENNISIILGKTHELPRRDDEDIDIAYKLPFILKSEAIPFCISMYDNAYWNHRNLPFQAGTAAAYGLTKEEALRSITLDAAKILGIDKKAGSLEVGKDANIIISEGDILDMSSSQIKYIFIQGRNIEVTNIQIQQYERYMEKYGLTK